MQSRFGHLHLCLILAACCIATSRLPAQEPGLQRIELRGQTMGTVSWRVVTFADPAQESQLNAAIEEALHLVNDRMSTYKPDSEVSRFNSSESTDWFAVSPETATVVARAQEISRQSDGSLDITVAPLVNLWKFGPDKSEFRIPDAATIDRVRQLTGYANLSVRRDPPALRKSISGLQIDLSAIAKGYAVDLIAKNLASQGMESFLIDVGGELRAAGEKPGGIPWTAGVEKPVVDRRVVWSVLQLYHKSLASSGDYRNFYELDGKRYSHTIDPRTGRPVTGGPAAVSVLASDCMTADAVATAVMVSGPESGLKLAEQLNVELLVLMPATGKEKFREVTTANWPANRIAASPRQAGDTSIFRTIAVASVFFLLAVVAMSVGVLFGRQRIRGSCGGIAALDNPDVEAECSLCSNPGRECRELKKAMKSNRGNEKSPGDN